MKIFVIDFETTGTDVATCQVLQFAIMFLDTEKGFPKSIDSAEIASWYFLQKEVTFKLDGLTAGWMNKHYFEVVSGKIELKNWEKIIAFGNEVDKAKFTCEVARFIRKAIGATDTEMLTINVAAKNGSKFDVPLFERHIPVANIRLRYRVLDPSILWVKPFDECLPDMTQIINRMTEEGIVTYPEMLHDAGYDAYHLAQALYNKIEKPS